MALDLTSSAINGIPQGLFYYFANKSDSLGFIGFCPSVQCVIWTPFLDENDVSTREVSYNYAKFSDIQIPATLKRVESFNENGKTLGRTNKYRVETKPIQSGVASWQNESRLYQHPYETALLTDYMDEVYPINYSLVTGNVINVSVKNTISDTCSYYLYIDGYKNDTTFKLEGIVSSGNRELPISNSAYTNYMAYNKNKLANTENANKLQYLWNKEYINSDYQNAETNRQIDAIGTTGNNIVRALTGNALGGAIGQGNSYLTNEKTKINNSYNNTQSNIKNYRTRALAEQEILATKKDLMDAPSSVSGMGSNAIFSMVYGDRKLDVIRYRAKNEYREKLGSYFIKYGYKANKNMNLSKVVRNRKYFNFVKCSFANISGGIPGNHLNQIKEIFERGVTLWHMESGITIGDYTKDNEEKYEYC